MKEFEMGVRMGSAVQDRRRWETDIFKALELAASMEARKRRGVEKCMFGRGFIYI